MTTTETTLERALDDYLGVRRALGMKLADAGRQLADFVDYMDGAGASTVTTEAAVAWAMKPTGCTPAWWARRLAMVRGFAGHLKGIDPATEVPPRGLLPHRCQRVAPYLYSPADIAALMAAARSLPCPQRAATYETLIGLLAVTGMRSGEARRLDRDHIDWDEALVMVWNSKFNKSRAIPIHASTVEALRRYARIRDTYHPHPRSSAFFLSMAGTRLDSSGMSKVFARLVREDGLGRPGERTPHPHDLRHTYAVRTLLDWCRAGADVDARMPLLSAMLGHTDPENTFWYLSGVPELLLLASQRLEQTERSRV